MSTWWNACVQQLLWVWSLQGIENAMLPFSSILHAVITLKSWIGCKPCKRVDGLNYQTHDAARQHRTMPIRRNYRCTNHTCSHDDVPGKRKLTDFECFACNLTRRLGSQMGTSNINVWNRAEIDSSPSGPRQILISYHILSRHRRQSSRGEGLTAISELCPKSLTPCNGIARNRNLTIPHTFIHEP